LLPAATARQVSFISLPSYAAPGRCTRAWSRRAVRDRRARGLRGHRHRIRRHHDAPGRCPAAAHPCSTAHRGASSPFLFAVSSSTVSPRSGPSTSPRRRAWSRRPAARPARRPGAAGCSTCRCGGWRGAAGPAAWEMATMTYETYKHSVAVATFPSFPFLSFLFPAWSRRTASQRRHRRRNVPGVGWGRSLSALALESQRAALAHHLRRRSICGGEARDGRVGQQINVRRGRVISLAHVGKLQQVRLTRGLPHDLLLAAPPPGDRRSRHRGSLSGTTPR